MWIVKVALSRPYTFIVLVLLMLILSPMIISRTPTDVFPNIDIPVIAVAWQVYRPEPGRDGGAADDGLRTNPHDHGRQHRTP